MRPMERFDVHVALAEDELRARPEGARGYGLLILLIAIGLGIVIGCLAPTQIVQDLTAFGHGQGQVGGMIAALRETMLR
jgi:hypothetical protein